MSKVSHQAKVYNMLKAANGPVTVEQLLTIEGILPYKLSAYVLYAKGDYGAVIRAVRDGRTVVAYEMTDAGTGVKAIPVKANAVSATPKVAKAPKAPKVAKAPKIAKAPKATKKMIAPAPDIESMRNDRIVDILDEMDTSIEAFEDREFAEDYIRSL